MNLWPLIMEFIYLFTLMNLWPSLSSNLPDDESPVTTYIYNTYTVYRVINYYFFSEHRFSKIKKPRKPENNKKKIKP
jgi:hypothetical protein